MARGANVVQVQDELIDALKWGEEAKARERVFELGDGPKEIRAVLEAMLEDSHGLTRQAAAFGLGELGGAASVRLLEQQLTVEEARDDHDGEAVVEDIVQALGRIDEHGARVALVRKLERLAQGKPGRSELYVLAGALWRRRHPDLIPAVRQSLAQVSLSGPHGLHGLLVLLEKSPDDLASWARDPAVPVEDKEEVLVVLEEQVPIAWMPALPAFIVAAQVLGEQAMRDPKVASYCKRLFSLVLRDRQRFIGALPEEARLALRAVALSLMTVSSPKPALGAAVILGEVGHPEDAAFLEAHRPDDPTLVKVFDDAARTLRSLQKH